MQVRAVSQLSQTVTTVSRLSGCFTTVTATPASDKPFMCLDQVSVLDVTSCVVQVRAVSRRSRQRLHGTPLLHGHHGTPGGGQAEPLLVVRVLQAPNAAGYQVRLDRRRFCAASVLYPCRTERERGPWSPCVWQR